MYIAKVNKFMNAKIMVLQEGLVALWAKNQKLLRNLCRQSVLGLEGALGPARACGGVQYGMVCFRFPCLVHSKLVGVHRVTYMVINNSNDTAEGLSISGLCGNSLC